MAWPSLRSGAVAVVTSTVLAVAAVALINPSAGAAPTAAPSSRSATSAAEYFDQMSEILGYATSTGPEQGTAPASAHEQFTMAIAAYQDLLDQAAEVDPPRQYRKLHREYRAALSANIAAFRAADARTPYDAPTDQWYSYAYSTPALGYSFGDETQAQCDLAEAADAAGFEDFPSRQACDEGPSRTRTVGTAAAPVNNVTITHVPACDGRCPNLVYETSSIVAKAGTPITIVFDNQNPFPFLFNLAIYKGTASTLKAGNQIAYTSASGPKTHTLTVTLPPGTYTYTDNVHPYSLRGTLTVVR